MQPLIKILKEIFCKFDKNKIHKERTFIFPLRPYNGYGIRKKTSIFPLRPYNGYGIKDFYIINNKENMLKYDEEEEKFYGFYYDVKKMELIKKDKKDKRKFRYYDIVLDYSLKKLDLKI